MSKKNPITEWMAKIGSSGGFARAQRMTPMQRSEAARNAVRVRWEKERAAGQNELKPKPAAPAKERNVKKAADQTKKKGR